MNHQKISRDLHELSEHYVARSAAPNDGLIVEGFGLPNGFNRAMTKFLITIPADYPDVAPGVASAIYVERGLLFHGRQLADVHEHINPGWGAWAWVCFQAIAWSEHDSLLSLMELLRVSLTNPRVKKGFFEWLFNQ